MVQSIYTLQMYEIVVKYGDNKKRTAWHTPYSSFYLDKILFFLFLWIHNDFDKVSLRYKFFGKFLYIFFR